MFNFLPWNSLAVRVGTKPEVLLMGSSEEKAYGISLFPLPDFQNRHFSKVERNTDGSKKAKAESKGQIKKVWALSFMNCCDFDVPLLSISSSAKWRYYHLPRRTKKWGHLAILLNSLSFPPHHNYNTSCEIAEWSAKSLECRAGLTFPMPSQWRVGSHESPWASVSSWSLLPF